MPLAAAVSTRSPKFFIGNPAQLAQPEGSHSPTRDPLGNSTADCCCPILDVIKVEAANHRPGLIREHIESDLLRLLRSQQVSMLL